MSTITNIPKSYYSNDHTRYVFLDGLACDSLEKCYHNLQKQLSIPDYFGHNLDALEEILTDLEWIEEEKIVLIILNKQELLRNDMDKKNDFLAVLESAGSTQLEIVYLDGV